jgi:hypothetical protein
MDFFGGCIDFLVGYGKKYINILLQITTIIILILAEIITRTRTLVTIIKGTQ